MFFLTVFLIFFVNVGDAGEYPYWCDPEGEAQFQVIPAAPIGLGNRDLLVKIKNPTSFKECEVVSTRVNASWIVKPGKNETNPGLYYWGNEKNNECGFVISPVKKSNVGKYRIQIKDEMSQSFAQCIDVAYTGK